METCPFETATGYVCVLEPHAGNVHMLVQQYQIALIPHTFTRPEVWLLKAAGILVYCLVIVVLILYALGKLP